MFLSIRLSPRVLAFAGATLAFVNAHAQRANVVDPLSVGCECAIRISFVRTLGNGDSLAFPPIALSVAMNHRGETVVAPVSDMQHAAVFDSAGRLQRLISGSSTSPGVLLSMAVDSEDSVYLFDANLREMSVLSPNFVPIRRAPVSLNAVSAIVPSDAGIIVHAIVHSPTAFGLPIHVIGRSGRILRSFGNLDSSVPLDSLTTLRRIMAVASASTIWTVRPDRYVLEEWGMDGTRKRSIARAPNWFEPSQPGQFRPDVRRPGADIRALQMDDHGRIWVLATAAKVDWRARGSASARDSPSRGVFPPSDLGQYLDSFVEVIDGKTGKLLASARIQPALLGFAGPGLVFSRRRTSKTTEALDTWQFRLANP